ncbi:MAG TPA: hypothetical protein VH165_30745 [Kofleriaceae bacterium]|nr:hypothetical protein [Kofleriaceae bacterium]
MCFDPLLRNSSLSSGCAQRPNLEIDPAVAGDWQSYARQHRGVDLATNLAALLLDELALTPVEKDDKVQLPKEQNMQLGRWQHQHLRLTWHAAPKPWLLECAVIAKLRPPLNLAANQDHAFYSTLSDARRRLKQAAR